MVVQNEIVRRSERSEFRRTNVVTHTKGPRIDISVLRIPDWQQFHYPLNCSRLSPGTNQTLPLRIGQTCFIVGFPEGLIHRPLKDAILAIRKTGHIASKPMFDFDDEPKLLIDATTRTGMSGAIVAASEGIRHRLVGIYSGWYKQALIGDGYEDNSEFRTELGWVFRSEVIPALLS